MAEFETGYQALGSFYEEDHEGPPADNIIHVVPDSSKVRWNHIENLDEFFTRVYQYHQRSGFSCMVLQDILQLLQFLFVVLFSSFLLECVDYDVLFYEKEYNGTHKVTIGEAICPLDKCIHNMDGFVVLLLILASLFFIFRVIKLVYNIFLYIEIRSFYTQALKVTSFDLANMTWHEVQRRLLEVQKEQQMCIHKTELTELDIYHRILRFKNYMVAMVNKSLLPLKYRLPFVGEYVFLTTGLKYNLEMLLFWGPWSPFQNNWHLKPDYKNFHKRKELANRLSRHILWIGIANLILSPIIFLWQILYSFFRYAEAIKREPSSLGSRHWSLFSRLYLRHFNELDHEFNARLNRGYKPAEKYMNIFTSPLLVVLAKHIAFFAGSLLAVLIILTIIDEDFLSVSHVIGTMTILGVILTVCHACIPDEHQVWCPELLMRHVLAQIHYIPDSWKGNAHTFRVRDEFAILFQYRLVYLLEELFSPIITPFVLILSIRGKSLEVVDFLRNFTVEVTGVGDVCSFAQMDVRRHGHPQWVQEGTTEANQYQQAEDGKTELSLMHFTLTNPEWKPPDVGNAFLAQLKEQAVKDVNMMSMMPLDNPLSTSLHSMSSIGYGYNSLFNSMGPLSMMPGGLSHSSTFPPAGPSSSSQSAGAGGRLTSSGGATLHGSGSSSGAASTVRGGIKNAEGPLGGAGTGLLASVHQAAAAIHHSAGTQTTAAPPPTPAGVDPFPSLGMPSLGSMRPPMAAFGTSRAGVPVDEETLEMFSQEMSFSALYLHELHRRRMNNPYYDNYEDLHARAMWQTPESPPAADSATSPTPPPPPIRGTVTSPSSPPPTIQEVTREEETVDDSNGDDDGCTRPLLDLGSPKLHKSS